MFDWLRAQDRLPLADMAKNAWLGWEVSRAARTGDLVEVAALLNAHNVWPFGFSLLLLPSFLVGGQSFEAAAATSLACFSLLPIAVVWVAWRIDPGPEGLAAGTLAAALVLTSPLAALFSILVLRETAGMLFLLVAIALYLRAAGSPSLGSWRLAAGALLLLFSIKYNYALMLALPIAVDRALASRDLELHGLSRWLRATIASARSPHRLEFWIAASLAAVTIPWIAGHNPGGMLFAVLAIWTLALIVKRRTLGRAAVTRIRELPAFARAFVEVLAVPLWIWYLGPSPLHARGLFDFLANRDSGMTFLAGLDSYWRAFSRQILPDPALALGVGAVAIASIAGWRSRPALRFVGLVAIATALLPVLHPYKQGRFLLTALPPIALVAAFGAARLARLRSLRGGAFALAPLLAVAAAAALGSVHPVPAFDFVQREYPASSAPASHREALDAIAEVTPRAGRVALLGTHNALSRELVVWHLAAGNEEPPNWVGLPSRSAMLAASSSAPQRLAAWLEEERPTAVVVVRLASRHPLRKDGDYLNYSRWQVAVADELVDRLGWRVEAARRLPGLKLRVERLAPAPESRRATATAYEAPDAPLKSRPRARRR